VTKARKKKAEAVDLMAALEASLAPYKRPPHEHRMGASMYAGSGGTLQRKCLDCGAVSYVLRVEGYTYIWSDPKTPEKYAKRLTSGAACPILEI